MNLAISKLFGVVLAAAVVSVPSRVEGLPVDLGAAGPGNWSVLLIGDDKVSLSHSSGLVVGNVGIYSNGELKSSGPDIIGDIYLGTGATADFSGSANATGAIIQNSASQALLNQARTDALAAAAQAKLLTGSTIPNITSTMSLNAGVYYLDKIDLGNGEVLTLNGNASDSFVFNISEDFKLNSADILLSGGLTEDNVLFNYFGNHDVSFSGGGNSSELHGIILSIGRKVSLSPGLVIGEIISDKDISIVSAAQVHGVGVPETGSTLLLSFLGLGSVLLLATRCQRKLT